MKVYGEKEILKNLKKYTKVVSESTEQGLVEIGERGVGYAKRESPVDTGRLRNSMSYTTGGKVSSSANGSVNPTSRKDTVYIGTNVVYAPSVEYLSKNGSAGFMYRAYQGLKKVSGKILQTAIKGGVK